MLQVAASVQGTLKLTGDSEEAKNKVNISHWGCIKAAFAALLPFSDLSSPAALAVGQGIIPETIRTSSPYLSPSLTSAFGR